MTSTQQELKNLKGDMVELKSLLTEKAKDKVEEATSNNDNTIINRAELQRIANQAGRGIRSYFTNKKRQLSRTKSACEESIKERPFTSTAVAFAGGILLASLLKRK